MRAHSAYFNCLDLRDNRNLKSGAVAPDPAYSDASRTYCTLL